MLTTVFLEQRRKMQGVILIYLYWSNAFANCRCRLFDFSLSEIQKLFCFCLVPVESYFSKLFVCRCWYCKYGDRSTQSFCV